MSSYGSRWPGTPAFTAQVASAGVYANTDTPLSVVGGGGGGTPPSNVPAIQLNYATTSTIDVYFDSATTEGSQPIDYAISINQNGSYVAPTIIPTILRGTLYTSLISSFLGNPLIPGASYYFFNNATNSAGYSRNGPTALSTILSGNQAPSGPPSTCIAGQINTTSITINFSAEGITGSAPFTFNVVYGLGRLTNFVQATYTGIGTLFFANITGLLPGTVYQFASQVANTYGEKTSATVNIATASSGTAPNISPTVPLINGLPGATFLNVYFDTAGVTGTPTPTYQAFYGTSLPTTPLIATLSTGTTIYTARADQLQPSTIYYFTSQASNTAGISTSALSIGMQTTPVSGIPPGNFTAPLLQTAGPSSLLVYFDSQNITGTPPITYSISIFNTPAPVAPTITPVLSTGTTIYKSLVSSFQGDILTQNTNYYLGNVLSNASGSAFSVPILMSTIINPSSINIGPTPPTLFNSAGLASTTTVWFNTVGITGTPTPTYNAIYGPTTVPSSQFSTVTATLSSGTIYTANVPIPNSDVYYYILSQASNNGPSVNSVMPLQFIPVPPSTTSPVTNPPADLAPYFITSTFITTQMPAPPGPFPNPLPFYTTLYGIASNALNSSTIMTFNRTYNVYNATISSLTYGTPYYFQAQATNGFSATSSAITAISTLG